MFRIRDCKNGLFQVHKSGLKEGYEGTPRLVAEKAIQLGIHQNDLAYALFNLGKQNFDYADFNDKGRYNGMFQDPPKRG